jgi:CheY-like chemotaxis protein
MRNETPILMIEDNERNQYLQSYLLEARGWKVVCAGDGITGIQMAKDLNPVLILLDIQLPGMDGHAVARALRADETIADIPIVAVTSYAMQGDRELCLAAGCDGYLEKPIDPETFVADVERFMKGTR